MMPLKELANRLGIAEETIKGHSQRISELESILVSYDSGVKAFTELGQEQKKQVAEYRAEIISKYNHVIGVLEEEGRRLSESARMVATSGAQADRIEKAVARMQRDGVFQVLRSILGTIPALTVGLFAFQSHVHNVSGAAILVMSPAGIILAMIGIAIAVLGYMLIVGLWHKLRAKINGNG